MYLLFLFSLEVRVHLRVKVACVWLCVNAVHACTCAHASTQTMLDIMP